MERESQDGNTLDPGFEQFLKDSSLSGGITETEIEFLRRLKFNGRRPSPLYYYRELQNLRDPLHFPAEAQRDGSIDPTSARNAAIPTRV